MNNACSVSNMSEYIAALENHNLFECISRGENKLYSFPISSGIQRKKLENYYEMLEAFHLEVEPSLSPIQEKNFLAFSQHHGLPTNLIDFSMSPLVSLFFAASGKNEKSEKGYVYFIKKSKTISVNTVITKKSFGWSVLDDLFEWDFDLLNVVYPQMSNVFKKNRLEMLAFFNEHADNYIRTFKQRRLPEYLSSIVGVSRFEAALEKYRKDCRSWTREGKEVTLQVLDSAPNFINALIAVYKGHIGYPEQFIQKYTRFPMEKIQKARYAANIDVMLFLLMMEIIEQRDIRLPLSNEITINYEMDFPFYFIYQPPVIDERVKNQSSIFSVQLFSMSINPITEKTEQVWLKIRPDFTIEVNESETILRELNALGINSKYIYSDYDHIAQHIVSQM